MKSHCYCVQSEPIDGVESKHCVGQHDNSENFGNNNKIGQMYLLLTKMWLNQAKILFILILVSLFYREFLSKFGQSAFLFTSIFFLMFGFALHV